MAAAALEEEHGRLEKTTVTGTVALSAPEAAGTAKSALLASR
jgi:hypothetical protein